MKDIDSGNIGIRDAGVDDRDEGTGGVSCTDADTIEARTRNVDQRENVNHIEVLDDIPINERSGDEFELVGERNRNASYDTTCNHTNMSHPSVYENGKTVTLNSERVIELEKKTMMLSILRSETKLLKLLKKLKLLSISERET